MRDNAPTSDQDRALDALARRHGSISVGLADRVGELRVRALDGSRAVYTVDASGWPTIIARARQ